jgi:ferritin
LKQLISDNLNSKLDGLVTKCFEGNRIADRGMSILAVKFAMNKTEALLHAKLAHLYPALADLISEYQGMRDNLTVYGLTPLEDTDYASPLELFNRLLDYMQDLENLISGAVSSAKEEEDFMTFAFLLEFSRTVAKVTGQCLLLVDKAENYSDWQLFDHNIEDFVIL